MNDLEDLAEEDYECMRKAIQDKEQDNLKDFNSRIVNELFKMGPKALKELQLQSSLPQSQNHPAEEQSPASFEEGNQREESEPIFGIDYIGNSSEDDFLSAKFHREREAAQSFAHASSADPLQNGCLFNVLKTTLRKLEQYIANTLGKSIISLPAQDVRKLSKVLQSPRSILSNSHAQTLRTMVRLAYQSEPQGRHPEMINLYSELIHYLQREKESKRAFGRPIDSEVQNRICQLYVEHETLDKVREELRSSCPAWKDEGNAGIKWRLEHIMRLSLRKLEAVIAEMEEKQFRPILKENERRMIVHCQEAHQTRIQLVKFYLQQDCDIPELLILTKSIAESLKRIHKRTEKGRNRTSQRNRRTAVEEQKELDLEESQVESASSSEIRTYRYRSKRRSKESKPQQTKRRSHNAPKPEKKQLTLQESYERRETSKSGEQKRRGLGSCWEDDKFIEQIARSINKEMKLAKRR